VARGADVFELGEDRLDGGGVFAVGLGLIEITGIERGKLYTVDRLGGGFGGEGGVVFDELFEEAADAAIGEFSEGVERAVARTIGGDLGFLAPGAGGGGG